MNTTRFSFFQTSADFNGTLLAAMADFNARNPGKTAIAAAYLCASPGDENGNRYIEVEITFTKE
jgi:hypothetical protein